MRRAVAALMSVLFSLMLIAPAIAAPAQSIPECCRRLGKHHCATPKSTSDGPAVLTARCVQFQWQVGTVTPHHPGIVSGTRTIEPGETWRLLSVAPQTTFANLAVRFIRTRGPPQV